MYDLFILQMEMNATSQVINKANYTIYCVPFGVSEQVNQIVFIY